MIQNYEPPPFQFLQPHQEVEPSYRWTWAYAALVLGPHDKAVAAESWTLPAALWFAQGGGMAS